MKQIRGNIGRAGISLLAPPRDLELREHDQNSWQVISTSNFNGEPEDHFAHTTIHLSFTEASLPLYDGVRGPINSQVTLVETLISIYDKGVWVGDIDVMSSLWTLALQRLPQRHSDCPHGSERAPSTELLSIESWDEVLRPPVESMVIRASGNWTARLAIAAMLIQVLKVQQPADIQGCIGICPDSVCWKCLVSTTNIDSSLLPSRPLSHRRIYVY